MYKRISWILLGLAMLTIGITTSSWVSAQNINSSKRYMVVAREDLGNLRRNVEHHMNSSGWRPIGGVSFGNKEYLQAMIK